MSVLALCSCEEHREHDDEINNEDVLKSIPFAYSNRLILVNPTMNDFNDYGRLAIMRKISDKLEEMGVNIELSVVVSISDYSPQIRKLVRINNLEQYVILMSEDSVENLRRILKTRRSLAMLVGAGKSFLDIGMIERPDFKQTIYNHFYSGGKSVLDMSDSIVNIKANTDTVVQIRNAGRSILKIFDMDSSCECSKVTIDKNEIRPGEIANLYIKHQTNGRVKARTNILLYSNDISGIKQIFVAAQE